jgi:hypothetical protein
VSSAKAFPNPRPERRNQNLQSHSGARCFGRDQKLRHLYRSSPACSSLNLANHSARRFAGHEATISAFDGADTTTWDGSTIALVDLSTDSVTEPALPYAIDINPDMVVVDTPHYPGGGLFDWVLQIDDALARLQIHKHP